MFAANLQVHLSYDKSIYRVPTPQFFRTYLLENFALLFVTRPLWRQEMPLSVPLGFTFCFFEKGEGTSFFQSVLFHSPSCCEANSAFFCMQYSYGDFMLKAKQRGCVCVSRVFFCITNKFNVIFNPLFSPYIVSFQDVSFLELFVLCQIFDVRI